MKSIFGESIQFESDEEFKEFIESIDRFDSLLLLETALNYASKMGVFNLEESFYIYNCLKKIKDNDLT